MASADCTHWEMVFTQHVKSFMLTPDFNLWNILFYPPLFTIAPFTIATTQWTLDKPH